ncbi:hypothetical protein MTX20_36840 [Bradyrhizobium sp. ISRA435]|nr:hypothetical protein MTX20_36840 [Bradyrhizobium sp. ISRA435]
MRDPKEGIHAISGALKLNDMKVRRQPAGDGILDQRNVLRPGVGTKPNEYEIPFHSSIALSSLSWIGTSGSMSADSRPQR